MSSKVDVRKMAKDLHEAGVLNADMKVSDLLNIQGMESVDPNEGVMTTVVAYDGYVVILADRLKAAAADKVSAGSVEDRVREDLVNKLLSDTRK